MKIKLTMELSEDIVEEIKKEYDVKNNHDLEVAIKTLMLQGIQENDRYQVESIDVSVVDKYPNDVKDKMFSNYFRENTTYGKEGQYKMFDNEVKNDSNS